MQIYEKKIIEDEVVFNLKDYLKDETKKNLYGKVKKHMNNLAENDAKIYLQEINKNGFLNLLKMEVSLIDSNH